MFRFFKNNIQKIRLRKISESNQAVVGIVVAVLLIGLVVTIISVIQLIYVPNWMEEIESEHIDEVFNQFSQLKLVIDTQTAINKTFTPIVTSINLGSNKIPFFMSTQAAGALNISNDASYINIYNASNGNYSWTNYSLGSIRYTSVNAYYIPEERISFIYENGAVITNQNEKNSLNIKPSFECNGISIYFNIVDIYGVGGKISKYGYDIDHIRTELNQSKLSHIKSVKYLNITTDYKYIWKSFIDSSLSKYWEEGNQYDYMDNEDDKNWISIKLNIDVDIHLLYSEIYAQIGPGWIDV